MIVSNWTIDRGRSYELDQNSPGTASITLIDTTGELDPSGTAYSFEVGTPGAIALNNPVTGIASTIFRGWVTRINYDLYQTQKYATVTVDLADGLDRLANMEMYGGQGYGSVWGDFPRLSEQGDITFFADSTSAAVKHRIDQVLDQAGWPTGQREIFTGNVSLQSVVYSYRTSAMTAIQDAADAEFPGVANFYVAKDGKATFHGRQARFKPDDAQYKISKWRCGDMAAVTADPTRALVFELAYDRDVEKVINSAHATPMNAPDTSAIIDPQRVEDAGSIASYGTRSVSYDSLLTAGDRTSGFGYGYTPAALTATRKFANYYVSNFAQPKTRVNHITFKRVGPTDQYAPRLWALMCGVDISDIIRLKTTHPGGGFDADFYVEGLHYSASPLSDTYVDVELTLDVSPRAYYTTDTFLDD